MKLLKQPNKEQIRRWLIGRATYPAPLPSAKEIRQQVGWTSSGGQPSQHSSNKGANTSTERSSMSIFNYFMFCCQASNWSAPIFVDTLPTDLIADEI